MHRFAKILVLASSPTPLPSKLDAARGLAARNGAHVTVMDVVPDLSKRRRFLSLRGTEVDVQDASVDQRRDELSAVADGLGDISTDVHVAAGSPYVEVIRHVIAGGYDLVVTGLDGASRSRFAGSPTAMHLLRKCPVPVWVHSAASAGRTGVGIALGPLDPDRADAEMNQRLLQLAASMANRQDTTLHVLHAWELEGESMMRSPLMAMSKDEVDALADDARQTAASDVEKALTDIAHIPVEIEVHMRSGMAGVVIPRLVQRLELETLVMGTLSNGGVVGALMGNTAEQVLAEIDRSVLTLKPADFVTPLKL